MVLWCVKWTFLIWLFSGIFVNVLGDYNFTYHMAAQCREFVASQYKYENYYTYPEANTKKKGDGYVFEMHIAVVGHSNAHVLLSTDKYPSASDPVYEIVIGGAANTFVELRRNMRKNSKATKVFKDILSMVNYHAFYIRQHTDGLIEFGREGDELPLLSYHDLDPVTINYFSFASWPRTMVKFLFDCPVAGPNGTEIASKTKSEEVESNLPPSEKLKRSFMKSRPAHVPPSQGMQVELNFIFTQINYDVFSSKLTTGLYIGMIWKDEGMTWDPTKYNGTRVLMFKPGEIWKPVLKARDLSSDPIDSFGGLQTMSVNYNGTALFGFNTKLETFCYDANSNWPNDKCQCTIQIHPYNMYEDISLSITGDFDEKMMLITDENELVRMEWAITGDHIVVKDKDWDLVRDLGYIADQTVPTSTVFIDLMLERRAGSYNIVLYVPLYVLVFFLLISFWTEPLIPARIWFYAGSATFVSTGLSYIDYIIPTHSVPSVLKLYICVLFGIVLALLVHVAMLHSALSKVYKSSVIQNLLVTRVFRIVFLLPEMKTSKNYETMDSSNDFDDDAEATVPYEDVQEMDMDGATFDSQKECAEVVDKIMFVVYSIVFAFLLAFHY